MPLLSRSWRPVSREPIDEQVTQALDSTEGFNLVIAACKVFLEHGIDPRLIADKNPDGIRKDD